MVAARHRLAWWAAAVGLATVTAWQMSTATADADRARQQWGQFTAVAVAVGDLAPGDTIGAGDLRLADVPLAVVPGTAVSHDAIGERVVRGLSAGEMVVAADLAGPGALPPNTRGVAVPVVGTGVPVGIGDLVELIGWSDPVLGGDGGATTIAVGSVLDAGDGSVTVAVDAGDVAAVVAAINLGSVSIVTR